MNKIATFADAGPDHSAGVMLCVRPDSPERFILGSGLPVEEIHLTLLYFGTTEEFDGSAAQQATEVINAEIAPAFKPIRGEVTAVTTFGASGEDNPPLVLLVDAPGLTELQQDCQGRLRAALGSNHQPHSNHGFMPHLTLGYGANEADIEFAQSLVGQPVQFDNIEFVWGTESSVWSLGKRHEGTSIADQDEGFGLQLEEELPSPRMDSYSADAEEAHGMSNENEATVADRDARLSVVDEFLAADSFAAPPTTQERRDSAKKGHAMPDGSYPIETRADLEDAIHAVGRGNADHDAIRKHIIKQAKRLNADDAIPPDWNSDGTVKGGENSNESEFAPVAPAAPVAEAPAPPDMQSPGPLDGMVPEHLDGMGDPCPGSGEPCDPSSGLDCCPVCGMPVDDMIPEDDSVPPPPIGPGGMAVEVDEEFIASGAASLPFAPLNRPWGQAEARSRLKGLDPEVAARAFLANGAIAFADVIDGELVAVPKGLIHIASTFASGFDAGLGAHVKNRLDFYFARMREEFGDESIVAPWERGVFTTYDATDHSTFAAVPVHHTATTDSKDFDGDVVKTRTRHGETPAYYDSIYAWHDSTGKPTNKTTYRFPHHQVSESGDPGAAVGWACHAALMTIDDSGIPKGDYQGVYNHLAAHLKDAGLDVPKLGDDNLSVDEVRAAIATLREQPVALLATTVEEEAMDSPFDVTKMDDASLVGEFMRRYLESLSGAKDEQNADDEGDEFAPKKGVNPFPPKKKDDGTPEDAPKDDGDPEDKAEKPETPGEKPDAEDKKEAPEGDAKPAPEKGANPFPPKADKPDDGDPEDKKEAPETPGEKPDPEDKAEAPEEDPNKKAPVKAAAPPPEAAPSAPPAKPAGVPPVSPSQPPAEADPTKKKKMIGQGNGTYEWEGVLIVEGIPSGDGRMIDGNALTWRELPVPLMLQTVNAEGHSGAVICGSIHEIERMGQDIVGRGNFDSGPAGQEAKRLLTEGTMRGVSADIDSVKVDLRDSGGNSLNMEDVLFGEAQAMEVLVQGRIMGATLTPFPAFQEAHIEVLDNAAEDPALVAAGATFEGEVWRYRSPYPICVFGVHEPVEIVSLVASGAEEGYPLNPPTEWFALREMDEPMPFTVYPDGRVFGLVAAFGSCHIGFRNKCVEVPKSMSNYRYFRNKRTLTAEGEMIATGPIFMDTVHPNLRLRASDAEAHYAHTGCAVADVALYENEHGIVAAGALRPDATPEQVRRLRGSDISPDWRSIQGRLELVGLLGVNVSGFITPALAASGAPIQVETLTPRAQVNIATDEVESLVAAGSLGCSTCGDNGFSIGSDAVAQIIEMLSSHEAKLAELSEAVRPIRAERVFARMASLALDSASKTEVAEGE